ncbi:MAG: hypothetical protein ACFFAJ_10625 [Candidatus Hodarchaeota archaeon]
MGVKKRITETIPIIIIIFVSAMAFFGGFLETQTQEQAENTLKNANDAALEVDSAFSYAQFLISFDSDRILTAEEYFDEACFLSWELAEIISELNQNETDRILSRIENLLYYSHVWMIGTYCYVLDRAFFNYTSVELADKESFGFELVVYRSDWEAESPAPIRYYSLENFMNFWGFEPTMMVLILDYIDNSTGPLGFTTIEKFSIFSYKFILEKSIDRMQEDVDELKNSATQLFQRAEFISNVIGMITIATILASAMGSTLDYRDNKSYLSRIYASQQHDPSLLIEPKQRIPTLVLFLAAILSVSGLGIAILA